MNKTCVKCFRELSLEWFSTNNRNKDKKANICRDCSKRKYREYYYRNWEKEAERRKNKHGKLRAAAIEKYGKKCVCCGETEYDFLTIDHINNNGNEHKKELHGSLGHNLYQWLKNNKYPPGFQVLCMNCNLSKHKNNGRCIHEIKKEDQSRSS